MTACGEWAWRDPVGRVLRWFCGSSSCERVECRKKFYNARVMLLTAIVSEYNLKRFFTLTLDPGMIVGNPWVYIHHPWSKFRKRINRRFPGWKFVAVLERHKNRDVPHIHGFTNIWMSQAEWSEQWNASGGGKIVWVEQVKTADASEYVSKQLEVSRYVSKDTIKAPYKVEKQYRTLWRSKNTLAAYELQSEDGWCIIKDRVFDETGELSDFYAKKGIWDGSKEERKREDMEATCSPLLNEGTEDCIKHMETKKPEDERKKGEGSA